MDDAQVGLAVFPDHILQSIFSNLFGKDILTSRLVCKRWEEMFRRIDWKGYVSAQPAVYDRYSYLLRLNQRPGASRNDESIYSIPILRYFHSIDARTLKGREDYCRAPIGYMDTLNPLVQQARFNPQMLGRWASYFVYYTDLPIADFLPQTLPFDLDYLSYIIELSQRMTRFEPLRDLMTYSLDRGLRAPLEEILSKISLPPPSSLASPSSSSSSSSPSLSMPYRYRFRHFALNDDWKRDTDVNVDTVSIYTATWDQDRRRFETLAYVLERRPDLFTDSDKLLHASVVLDAICNVNLAGRVNSMQWDPDIRDIMKVKLEKMISQISDDSKEKTLTETIRDLPPTEPRIRVLDTSSRIRTLVHPWSETHIVESLIRRVRYSSEQLNSALLRSIVTISQWTYYSLDGCIPTYFEIFFLVGATDWEGALLTAGLWGNKWLCSTLLNIVTKRPNYREIVIRCREKAATMTDDAILTKDIHDTYDSDKIRRESQKRHQALAAFLDSLPLQGSP
jgi:hypothetical protein